MLGKTELEALTKSVVRARSHGLAGGLEMAGFLSKTELEQLLAGAVRTTVIDGGAAGDHTVTGIAVGDALRAVLKLDFTLTEGTPNTRTWAASDLTGEFSITGDNTINNAGGTDTTGAVLVVVYEDLTP
jgi:hypothetical protein